MKTAKELMPKRECEACGERNAPNLIYCMYCSHKLGDPVEKQNQENFKGECKDCLNYEKVSKVRGVCLNKAQNVGQYESCDDFTGVVDKQEIVDNAKPCPAEDCPECANYQGGEVDPSDIGEVDKDDEYEDIAHDDEFMDSIEEDSVKYTPEQAKARIEYLVKRNKDLAEKIETREKIAELGNHEGLSILIEELQKETHDNVDELELKEITKGVKALEAVLNTKTIISGKIRGLADQKRELKNNSDEIEKLGCYQTNLFDALENVSEVVEPESPETDVSDLVAEIPQKEEVEETA